MGKYLQLHYGSYGFILIALLVSLWAQFYVKKNYTKYRQVNNVRGLTGAQVARYILDSKGLHHVQVILSPHGQLSDHYDPRTKTVALSRDVYAGQSIASLAVASHEVGHAIQDAEDYMFLSLRNRLLPLAMVSSQLSYLPIAIGFLADIPSLFNIGILMLMVIAVFQLVTLPLEFNASSRALNILESESYLIQSEVNGARKMLTSAALTYVAALFGTMMTILRYISLNNSRNNDQ